MKLIFADTSFYQALISERDEHYEEALFLSAAVASGVTTTEWVLTELVNTFSRGAVRRRRVVELVDELRSSVQVLVVPAAPRDWSRGYDLFRRRADQGWSLVDCISFQLMWDREITQVLTFDEHFEQAGFERVR